ncbi:MAG: short chain dehydrogenase family protein [Pseudomonas sp.]|nr:short chain dehydrogenase family protein [Pseudomonas sp.]
MRYAGKVVLVTGAGGGIGRALCQAFAGEGAAIIAADLDGTQALETVQGIVASGGRGYAITVDVGDEAVVQRAIAEVLGLVGQIDVLINNAGIAYGDIYQLTTMPTERLQRLFDVNVFGMLFCARACRESLSSCGGVIINMSSMASYMANGAYSLSKAAVNNLTVVLADELASDGIRVNGIAPGLMDTPAAMQQVNVTFQKRIKEAQLIARQGTMDDVAELALFLASQQASFISGQTILVDGGYLRHSARAMPVPLAGLPSD